MARQVFVGYDGSSREIRVFMQTISQWIMP